MPREKKYKPKWIGPSKKVSDRELKRRKKADNIAFYNEYLAAEAAKVAAREQSAEVVRNVDSGWDDAGVELDFHFD